MDRKRPFGKSSKRSKLAAIVVLVVCLPFMRCTLGSEDTSKFPELRRIRAETPVFPGFVEIDSSHMGKRENAGLTYFYSSSATYEDVKNFYIRELTSKGWGYPTEEIVPKWILHDGSKALTFSKGEYTIEIEYNAAKESPWQFALDYGWEMK